MFSPLYLDYNATSPLLPEVLAEMRPWLEEGFGNPSSRHDYGRRALSALDDARERLAAALGASIGEVVFLSSGTEANNFLIKGFADACLVPKTLAISAIEHPCINRPAQQLVSRGWQVLELTVDSSGLIDRNYYSEVLQKNPSLISIMLANNESGVIQPLPDLLSMAAPTKPCFHTDAVQALGKLPISFRELNRQGLRAMTVSAHKIGGPKGAAALILDKRIELSPLLAGGGQEKGLRSGTENIPAIVGFAKAVELSVQMQPGRTIELATLKDYLERQLCALGAKIFSVEAPRLANTSFFAFPSVDGETLVGKLDRAGFAVASGAACSSGNQGISHVLKAMHVAPEIAKGAIRVSLGGNLSLLQIDQFIDALKITLRDLQNLTALQSPR